MAHDRPIVKVEGGRISVAPEPLKFERNRGTVVIIWRLDDSAAGFTFVDTVGIKIDNDQRREFDEQRVIAGGRQFQVRNKNSFPKQYKYTINLRAPDGRTVSLDPIIVNME